MRLHVLWRNIRFYWKRRSVRGIAALLVLAAAILVEYRLANIPLPVEIENNRVTIPPVKFGQELVVEGPLVDASTGLLLAHEGKSTEIVNVYLDQAWLSKDTASEQELDPRAASVPGLIKYTTRDGDEKRPPDYSRACSTSVEIRLAAENKLPGTIHFFQTNGPGGENYRDLEIRASGAELLVGLSTIPPEPSPDNIDADETGGDDGPGCLKQVAGAQWKKEMAGAFNVKSVVAADSKFNFRFLPMARNNPLWGGHDGLFEPFTLGPLGLQARAVSIHTPNGPTALEIRGADEKIPLRINSLKVGSDQFQVGVTGKGFVTVEGEDITVDLFERIKKYPFLAGLLVTANAALLAWFTRLVRSLVTG
jgi:hypothetical protein